MRLDRYDSYLTSFHASVVERRRDERGLWLRLDRSAFYPTAGGQPHDTGTLEAAPGPAFAVVDVSASDGAVWHLVSAGDEAAPDAPPEVGAAVVGRLDWPRRYRHMQRHSAQHLLSQALVRVNPALDTRSVSLRGPDCTVDCGGELDAEALAAVEREVNQAARRAMAITTFEVDDAHLGDYRLRRPAKVSGRVRLVAIGDYDLVACGGTHLGNSAEALPVKLLGSERVKGGLNRITFRAGEEALEDLALKHEVVGALGTALSVPAGGVLERFEQLRGELAAQGEALGAARQQLAAALAERLAAGADDGRVSAYLEPAEAPLLGDLVERLQRREGTVALLAAQQGEQVRFAFVAGPGTDVDVRPALRAAMAELGGKGGGRPDRAQGAAPADATTARAALRTALAHLNG